jgi:DHA2 family multidrug resistance protein
VPALQNLPTVTGKDGAVATYGRLPMVVITVCAVLATLIQALDSTIANVALPYMQGSFAASQDQINWVLTSYIVASAIMTAPTGFFASRFGRTRLYVGSIIGFTTTSVLCGMAQSLDQIVLFRVLQGFAGAALVPISQSVMYDIYPKEKRGQAMSLWGMGVQVGPVLGPILGGWLTANYSWRWVFYVNVPIGVIAATGLLIFLRESPRSRAIRMDWIGFGALSIGIAALQLALDRGEEMDWFSSPEIITEACIAGLGIYLFLVQSATAPKPLLSPALLRDRNFVIASVFVFILGLTLYASLALLAPYLQKLMSYPVLTAGIVLAPRGVGTMTAMLLSGYLIGRVSVRLLITLGFALNVCSLYATMGWTPDVSAQTIILVGVVQGFSIGLVFTPLSTIVYASLPLQLRNEAAGVYSLVRNLGSAIGISVTGALLQTNIQINHQTLVQFVTPFTHDLQSGIIGQLWNPASPSGAFALNAEITRQATVIAYQDDFRLMMILTLVVTPLALLIRPAGENIISLPQR